MSDRGDDGQHELGTDERVCAAPRVDQRDRDDRPGQEVGQQPLVEVDRQADDQRDEPGTEQRERERVRPEPQRQQAERQRPRPARRRPSASPTARPAGRSSSSCSGQRVASRSAPRPSTNPAAPSTPARSASGSMRWRAVSCRAGVGQPARAPASASSTRVACETPVAPRGANGEGLAVVGRPGDVEVDPRLRHELADEQAALDQRALGRARVLEVAVPAVHLGDVVVDQRRAASSARRPGRRPP